MADAKETKVPDTKLPEVSSAATPEKIEPKPLSNGLYLVIFDKAWDCYNAKEQAAFEKATAEHLVNRKLARYVPEKTA